MHIRLGLDILEHTGPRTVWLQQRNIYWKLNMLPTSKYIEYWNLINKKCRLEEFYTVWPRLFNLSSMKSH